jgi:hypothetical protein
MLKINFSKLGNWTDMQIDKVIPVTPLTSWMIGRSICRMIMSFKYIKINSRI